MSIRQFKDLRGRDIATADHVCVVFGGFAASLGKVGPVTKSTGTNVLLEKLQGLPLRIKDLHGSLSDQRVYETAFQHIRDHFSERGKLIIYGYSAGGINANELAKYIRRKYSHFKQGTFLTGGAEESEVCVDLLVTVDAYNGKDHRLGRDIPRNVALNINIYQTYPQGGTGSRGNANWPRDRARTRICNQDRSQWDKYKKWGTDSHTEIDEDTNDLVVEKISSLVGGEDLAAICKLRQ